MAAGERCCAVGVVRFMLGDVFAPKEVILEAHHGIEDGEGQVEYTRLEEHRVGWDTAKGLVSAAEWKAVLKFVAACENELVASLPSASGKRLEKFDEGKVGRPSAPFSPL
ncbi:MAG: hypothetical protein K8T20_11840 [Planctomycetes bacterium]|nr:hypothetical protein [Planctomycetota bacterium]